MKKHKAQNYVLKTDTRTVTATASEWRNNSPTKLTFHEEPSIDAKAMSEEEAKQIRLWLTWVDSQMPNHDTLEPMKVIFTNEALARRIFELEPETEAALQAEYDRLYPH